MFVPMLSWAKFVQIDGIYYNIIEKDKVAEVTNESGGTYDGYNSYSGSITIPETVEYNGTTCSVTSIGEFAFYSCSGLTSVTIPNSVTSIEGYAFYYCSGLTSVAIPNSVTSFGAGAFGYCSGLTSITIPNSVTSIGESAFSGCSGLTSISVEAGNSKYDSRENCNAIIESTTNTLIAGCQNTTIPNSVTCIGGSAFSGCSGLTSITIPNLVTSIGYGTFSYCHGLTSVTIPNSVTSIGRSAFYGCAGLTSVTIGSGVKNIGSYVFAKCENLETVTCLAEEVPATYADAFDDSQVENATLQVPDQSVAAYSSMSPWKDFGKIEGIKETAITLVQIDERYGDVEYYKLNGVKVDKPTQKGIYVVKKDGKTNRIVVKK